MMYYVTHNGEQFGPYDSTTLVTAVREGSFSASDFGWTEGMAQWLPLSQIVGMPAMKSPPPFIAPRPHYPPTPIAQAPVYLGGGKSAGTAFVLNFFFPGIGHAYAGRVASGIMTYFFCIVCAFFSWLIIPGIIVLCIWISRLASSGRVVEEYNQRMYGVVMRAPTAQQPRRSPLRAFIVILFAFIVGCVLVVALNK